MTSIYLALGSNLDQPLRQIEAALAALRQLPDTQLINCSPFYRSKPMGPQDQPDYLNAVAYLQSNLSPETLLDHTQAIEIQLGRSRNGERWGPRTLDLDLLLYGDQVINTPRLTIPHYGMKQREFVLYPLFELAPDLILPDGCHLAELIKQVPRNGLTLWHT